MAPDEQSEEPTRKTRRQNSRRQKLSKVNRETVLPQESNEETPSPGRAPAKSVPYRGCSGLKETVWKKFNRCREQTPGTSSSCPYVSIQDAETKRFFIVDTRSNRCVVNTHSAIGLNSGRAGNRNPSEARTKTPAGIFKTKKHVGKRYQSHNSIGLRGLSSENDRALPRGVVIHRYRGRTTWGCNGVQGFQRDVHPKLRNGGRYGCLHFNYFKKGQCGSANYSHKAPSYGRSGKKRPSRKYRKKRPSRRYKKKSSRR